MIKTTEIDPEGAARHDRIALSAEWRRQRVELLSVLLVKKWYLDELPQFWEWPSMYIGVLLVLDHRLGMHHERDKALGQCNSLVTGKAACFGLGHINKGTSEMGNSIYVVLANMLNSIKSDLLLGC